MIRVSRDMEEVVGDGAGDSEVVELLDFGDGMDRVEGDGIGASEATRDDFRFGIRKKCIEDEDA